MTHAEWTALAERCEKATAKPHGRLCWTLMFKKFGDPRFVDLSVMPRLAKGDAHD